MKTSQTGRSITLEVSLFLGANGHIPLIGKDARKKVFMTTVTDKPDNKRRHAHLFRQLSVLLSASDNFDSGS